MDRKETEAGVSIWKLAFSSFLLAFFLAFGSPLAVLAFSRSDTRIPLSSFLLESSLATLMYSTLFFIVLLITRVISAQGSATLLVFFVCWVIIATTIAPLSLRQDLAVTGPINMLNVALVFGLSLSISLFANLKRPKIMGGVLLFAVAFGSLNVLLTTGLSKDYFYAPNETRDEVSDIYTLGKGTNVLVISFDGLPGNLVQEILGEDGSIRSNFSDFIFFSNVVSNAPATTASITAEQFGERDYHLISETLDGAVEQLGVDNALANLLDKSWTYGAYSSLHSDDAKIIRPGELSGMPGYDGRFGSTQAFALRRTLGVPESLTAGFLNGLPGVQSYLGPTWAAGYRLSEFDYKQFVERLRAAETGGVELRQLHFVHTHFPVDYDSNCEFRGNDPVWHDTGGSFDSTNQNEEALKSQTRCALEEFIDLKIALKNLGVYDNTHIVFKSDHGEPRQYFKHFPENQKINGHETWGYSRYRPTLMIKPIDSRSANMIVETELVSLGDLARTHCEVLKQDQSNGCSYYPGRNLLFPLVAIPSNQYIHMQVPTDTKSGFRYEDHYTIKIPRSSAEFFEALQNVSDVKLSE